MKPEIIWRSKTFAQLTTLDLFEILKLRQTVFVVEQECAYADIDEVDKQAIHFSGHVGQKLAAYVRIIAAGITYSYASIGRVVVAPEFRGTGLGRRLMLQALAETSQLYPGEKIKIGAQAHLEPFYNSMGFTKASDEYLEDGIPHIDMLLDGDV